MIQIVEVTELHWPFGGDHPTCWTDKHVRVDPFPGYPHDFEAARDAAIHVCAAAPVKLAPKALYVLNYEPLERTNGWASADSDYHEETGEWAPTPGTIVLAGKRIPPHPAMTRYLIAHEYGHHVQYSLQADRGEPTHSDDGLLAEYAALRGHDHEVGARYGGGRWHSNTGELFANDFRILVAGVETEFWPHPGIPRPEQVDGLAEWWREVL